MANWASEFLAVADTPHERTSTQSEGELALAELARQCDVEYAWEFDSETQLWHYVPTECESQDHAFNDKITWSVMNLALAPELHLPHGRSSTMYHIHPSAIGEKIDEPEFASTIPVLLQIPSTSDIQACVNLTLNGYRGFKIVSAIGVTSLGFSLDKAQQTDGTVNLPGIKYDIVDILRVVSQKGVRAAIERVFDTFNHHYDGALDFQYASLE